MPAAVISSRLPAKTDDPVNAEDIKTVIERYRDMVYRIALTRTGNSADAEDVFQEVFLTYHRKQPVFTSEEHRKAWLIRVTINRSKKVIYSRGRNDGQFSDELGGSREDFTFAVDSQDLIFSALNKLPEKYRSVITLFYFEDMTTEQIASVLGLRAGTVRMRLSRGRERLHTLLEKEAG